MRDKNHAAITTSELGEATRHGDFMEHSSNRFQPPTAKQLESLIKRTINSVDREKRIIAYHEAAHAVVATVLGLHVAEVHIEHDGSSGGKCTFVRPRDLEQLRTSYLPAMLAGSEVEHYRFHVWYDHVLDHCAADYQKSEEVIARLWATTHDEPWCLDNYSCRFFYWAELKRAKRIARQAMQEHSVALRQLAALLIACSFVGDDQIVEIIWKDDHEWLLAHRMKNYLQNSTEFLAAKLQL